MKNNLAIIILLAVFIGLLATGPVAWYRNYRECRAQFSVMYCAKRR